MDVFGSSMLVVMGVCGCVEEGDGLSVPRDNTAELTREGMEESGNGGSCWGVPRAKAAD